MQRATFIRFFTLIFLFTAVLSPFSGWTATTKPAVKPITDLYRAYELWEGNGIKFVVRNDEGHFVTWGIGHLESWSGTRTVLAVRDSKGRFLTWAKGKIENWKNDTKRYVFRDKKGHFLQWAPLDFTSNGGFKKNLQRFSEANPQTTKHFSLLTEIIQETIIDDIKKGNREKAYRFLTFGFQYVQNVGSEEEKSRLTLILNPLLKFLKRQAILQQDNQDLQAMVNDFNDLAQMTL
jgi:hypothetical protein